MEPSDVAFGELDRSALSRTMAVLTGKGGVGKCIAAGETVYDTDSGVPLTVGSAVRSRLRRVASFTADRRIAPVPVGNWIDSGVKPTLRLELASGRNITVTRHHPMLAPEGWRHADRLQVGETIAGAGWCPSPIFPRPLQLHEVDRLAEQVAGGGVGLGTSGNGSGGHRGEQHTRGAVAVLPRPHRFDTDATMPEAVYQLPNDQLARFLAVLWMSEGHVSLRGTPGVTLASEHLVRALQHLLLRFGIQSSVTHRAANRPEDTDSWRLRVYSAYRAQFRDNIRLWGAKQDRLTVGRRRSNPNVGSPSLSPQLWERIRCCAHQGGRRRDGKPRLHDVADKLGWSFTGEKIPLLQLLTNPSANGQRYLSQRSLSAYLDTFDGHPDLGHLVAPTVFWDRITGIVDAGEQQVYDLTVPATANFVANDLIVHNTSITANVGGQLAAAGYRVLEIDLDVSGNLKLDLGYTSNPGDTEGKGIFEAVWEQQPLVVIPGVRDNLDVVPGGRHLELLTAVANSPAVADLPGGSVPEAFAAAVADIAGDYDVAIIDCAPGHSVLQDMALAAARYLLIPTRTDAAGWDGLRMIGPRVRKARQTNSDLTYLGVVLFGHQSNATRVRRNTYARLAEVSDRVPLFDAFVRYSETAAHDCRARGQLAHELASDAKLVAAQRFQALRAVGTELPPALSQTAGSLAGDYFALAREVLDRITAAEQRTEGEQL